MNIPALLLFLIESRLEKTCVNNENADQYDQHLCCKCPYHSYSLLLRRSVKYTTKNENSNTIYDHDLR